jgi:hypothetical protein
MYHQKLYQNQDDVEMIIDNNAVNARLEGINSDGSASVFYEGELRKVYHPQARIMVSRS